MNEISSKNLTWAMDTLLDSMRTYENDPATIYVSKEAYKLMKRVVAKGRRYDRARRLKKRQRRAHQRKHHRGEA